MHVTVIPGVGPATAERLRRAGITTVADLEGVSEDELVRLLGKAHGHGLHLLARAEDDRAVVPERETKSVSVEGTYDTDLTDPRLMAGLVTRQAANVAERLRKHGLSGRTVTLKVRLHDFTTLSRSTTLAAPTDAAPDDRPARPRPARRARHHRRRPPARGRRLRAGRLDPGRPVRRRRRRGRTTSRSTRCPELPGAPHLVARAWTSCTTSYGRGWVWGAGRGIVTVRFETAETPPGPVRSLPADDPALSPWQPAVKPHRLRPAAAARTATGPPPRPTATTG